MNLLFSDTANLEGMQQKIFRPFDNEQEKLARLGYEKGCIPKKKNCGYIFTNTILSVIPCVLM